MTKPLDERAFWHDALRPWPDELVAKMRIADDDAAYLRKVGLPVDVDWNLDIRVPTGALTVVGGLPVIARDGPVPICVEPTSNGTVVALEASGARFVNSSIRQFGVFLMLYQDYRCRVRSGDDDSAVVLIREVESSMAAVDPDAMGDPERYWPVIVEQMRDGLL